MLHFSIRLVIIGGTVSVNAVGCAFQCDVQSMQSAAIYCLYSQYMTVGTGSSAGAATNMAASSTDNVHHANGAVSTGTYMPARSGAFAAAAATGAAACRAAALSAIGKVYTLAALSGLVLWEMGAAALGRIHTGPACCAEQAHARSLQNSGACAMALYKKCCICVGTMVHGVAQLFAHLCQGRVLHECHQISSSLARYIYAGCLQGTCMLAAVASLTIVGCPSPSAEQRRTIQKSSGWHSDLAVLFAVGVAAIILQAVLGAVSVSLSAIAAAVIVGSLRYLNNIKRCCSRVRFYCVYVPACGKVCHSMLCRLLSWC